VKSCPELARFAAATPRGEPSIDFADPAAVRALNRALLSAYYGVAHWDIPDGSLCPPIPGRADYVHHVADLLASARGGRIPRGDGVRVLDVGVGASCVYPIIGRAEYGWSFAGSDVDAAALASAGRIVAANPVLTGGVELRFQASPGSVLAGVLREGEFFDAVMCNPPFHASLADAEADGRRKRRNLGLGAAAERNFGGRGAELWCPGGEGAFVRRMIEESAERRAGARWFTALISKEASLPGVEKALKKTGAAERRTIAMAQGQKKSRIVAWSFQGAR
jgi:23S rRNA (adenine1618-N6)-methyltransferase